VSDGRAIVADIIDRAKKKGTRIALPEYADDRVVEAAKRMKREKIAEPVMVVQRRDQIPDADIETEVIEASERLDKFAEMYVAGRRNEGIDKSVALRLVKKPMFFGALLTAVGETDAMIAGAAHATSVVILAAKMGVGMKEGVKDPSSFFIMVLREEAPCPEKVLIFADAAVFMDPDAEDLAEIGILTADNVKRLLGIEPRVAFLSFSTKSSARHPHVDKVVEAVRIAREKRPDIDLDGELQFDAAVIPKVADKKSPGSPVAGRANVLVFPDLDAANIGYKIAQWAGGAMAIGPVMQGFNKPVNDLSRGASVDDIVTLSAVTSLMCVKDEERT
jgi:phosphate acetyltransferase